MHCTVDGFASEGAAVTISGESAIVTWSEEDVTGDSGEREWQHCK